MKKIRLHSAGIDIGAKKLFLSIENQPTRMNLGNQNRIIKEKEIATTKLKEHQKQD
ncbi:MAG: hypothetical protein ABJK28_02740 [Algibacter sp.]